MTPHGREIRGEIGWFQLYQCSSHPRVTWALSPFVYTAPLRFTQREKIQTTYIIWQNSKPALVPDPQPLAREKIIVNELNFLNELNLGGGDCLERNATTQTIILRATRPLGNREPRSVRRTTAPS